MALTCKFPNYISLMISGFLHFMASLMFDMTFGNDSILFLYYFVFFNCYFCIVFHIYSHCWDLGMECILKLSR